MKKLLALLLVLATFLTSSGFLSFLFSQAVTDPVLVPATDIVVPEYSMTYLGGSRVLLNDRYNQSYPIYDLSTGSTTELYVRPQDRDAMRSLMEPALDAGIPGMPPNAADRYRVMLNENPDNLLFMTTNARAYPGLSQYVPFHTGFVDTLIDRETGAVLLAPEGTGIVGVTASDELLCRDNRTLYLYALDGTLKRSAELNFGDYYVSSIYPLDNGVLVLLHGSLMNPRSIPGAFAVLDQELKAGPVIELGTHRSFLSLMTPRQSIMSGIVLVPMQNMGGMLLLDPATGEYSMLVATEEEMYVLPNAEATQEQRDAFRNSTGMMAIVGLSQDGSYALISSVRRGLLKLDLETLTLTQQMTIEDLEAIDLEPLDAVYLVWDGGEYVVNHNRVFRLQNR